MEKSQNSFLEGKIGLKHLLTYILLLQVGYWGVPWVSYWSIPTIPHIETRFAPHGLVPPCAKICPLYDNYIGSRAPIQVSYCLEPIFGMLETLVTHRHPYLQWFVCDFLIWCTPPMQVGHHVRTFSYFFCDHEVLCKNKQCHSYDYAKRFKMRPLPADEVVGKVFNNEKMQLLRSIAQYFCDVGDYGDLIEDNSDATPKQDD